MKIINTLLHRRGVRQFVKFGIVGVFNTILDFSVYLLLTRVLGLYFLAANMLSVVSAMTFSFFMNKKFTFRDGSTEYVQQYAKFAVINVVGFALNNLLVYMLVEQLRYFDLLAKVSAVLVVMLWNFFAQKYWAFAVPKREKEPVNVDEDLI